MATQESKDPRTESCLSAHIDFAGADFVAYSLSNMSQSSTTSRIDAWLEDACCASDQTPKSNAHDNCDIKVLKGKQCDTDEARTPRPMRIRHDENASPTLTQNDLEGFDYTDALSFRAPSSQSNASSQNSRAGSRRSSPSKQQRLLAINFSGLTLLTIDANNAVAWQSERHTAEVPKLDALFACVSEPGSVEDVSLTEAANSIHAEVRRCLRRKANEAMWRDCVVYPTLRAARQLCGREEVDIINV